MYQVIGLDGARSTPVGLDGLRELAARGGITGETMVFDPVTDRTVRAEELLSSESALTPSGPASAGVVPTVPKPVVNATTEIGLGTRFVGLLIDNLLAFPLVWLALIPIIGLIGAPLLCAYYLSRDAFFGGQSVGKRVAKTRVVCLDGQKITYGQSVLRNITFLPAILLMIPVVGIVAFAVIGGIANLADIICVLSTKRRIGDHLAKSMVVSAE